MFEQQLLVSHHVATVKAQSMCSEVDSEESYKTNSRDIQNCIDKKMYKKAKKIP